MNISRIVRKVLSEEQGDENVKGLDLDNQIEILKKAIQYCTRYNKFFDDGVTTLPTELISFFPELRKMDKVSKITWSDPKTKAKYLFFGVEDPEAQTSGGKKAFLAYQLVPGRPPKKFRNGWGQDCDALQKVEVLGIDPLPEEFELILKSFIQRNPSYYSQFNPNSAEFEKILYKDLIDPETKKPVLPGYTGKGYIWVQTRLSNKNININQALDKMLVANKLTRKRPEDVTSDEFNFAFLLSDITDDLPGLEVDKNLDTSTIVWPAPGTIVEPTKESCRAAIKKLSDCSKSATESGCRQNLFANKITALMCGDRKFVGGAFGLKDEYASLLQDSGDFGLAKLNYARREGVKRAAAAPKDLTGINETIKNKVSKYLNEEYNRRNFRK